MAKNKQFNKNSKKQPGKTMHTFATKHTSESQIIVEETMEMRLDRCVQKVKDISELVIGYTPYKLNFVINSYSGITNKPSKVSAFANAVVGIILADGQSSFSHIGDVLGLNVDIDLAEQKMLKNAINQMLEIHLLEGDVSAYNVTDQGRTFAEHGEKMEPYPSKFSLWYVPEYVNYLNLHSDISESFVIQGLEEETRELPKLTLDNIKCLAEKQATHAHSSKDRYILQEASLEKSEFKSYELWACFIRSVRTKQVRLLIYDDNSQKILTELSSIIDSDEGLKKNLFDSMLGNNPDVEIIEQKDAVATEEQIKAEEDLLKAEEEHNTGKETVEASSSIEERLHKRALYDSISFESELHTIFQKDNADEIWLSSPWVGDDAFMQSRLPLIQAFINQGGKVFISYSEAEEGLDRSKGKGTMVGWQSNKAIKNLAKNYPGQFFYAQFSAFHSKNVIEVKNGQSILFTGSFNVLSFHVTSEHESHIRKEEMALAHYQVAENKYHDFKKQFAESYIKRAEESLEYLGENTILNYKNLSLEYFRKDIALAPLFADFDDKLDELRFAIRNKNFVRKTKANHVAETSLQDKKEESSSNDNSQNNINSVSSKEDKVQRALELARINIDADLIDNDSIFLKLCSLCYMSIGNNSQKVKLQIPWDVELTGFLSRGDVQNVTKINLMKGREEGTTNIHVLMNNTVFRFFNVKLSKSVFYTLFNRRENFPPGNQIAQAWEMSKIILERKKNV